MAETQATPRIGTWVITSDGKDAGKIAAVTQEYFKVAGPAILDYWLPVVDVIEATEKETLLSISKEELDHEKLASPPAV